MSIEIRHLGRVDYLPTYEAMQAFTEARSRDISGQIGLLSNEYGHGQLFNNEQIARSRSHQS